MASFTSKISITESNSADSIDNNYGSYTNVSNGKASSDQKTWGDSLTQNSGRKRLEFSKQYLTFTFELGRDSVNDSSGIVSGHLILYGTSRNVELYFGAIGSNILYTSQADELFNFVQSDKNMLLRFQVPTSSIYNIGEINKVYCGIENSQGERMHLDANLSDLEVLTYHKWNKGRLGKDSIERGSSYGYKTISPKLSYTGSINVYSKILNYNVETGCGGRYFTGSNGEIKVDVNDVVFFNTAGVRVPSHLFF